MSETYFDKQGGEHLYFSLSSDGVGGPGGPGGMHLRGGGPRCLLCLSQVRWTQRGAGWDGRGHSGRAREEAEGKRQGRVSEPCCGLLLVETDPETHRHETQVSK